MPHNLQHEAIAKFLIPNWPQQDNYLDPNEFEEKEKEWMEQQDLVLVWCTVWVNKEQVAEAKHAQEATVSSITMSWGSVYATTLCLQRSSTEKWGVLVKCNS